MKLIYMDEAGNTGLKDDPQQPYHLLAALLVDAEKVTSIENDARELAIATFGMTVANNQNFEFHGHEIKNGKGNFKAIKIDQRIELFRRIIEILNKNNIEIIWAMVKKSSCVHHRHPHQVAFQFIVERIQDYLSKKSKLGLIIADENKEIEQNLIDDIDQYKRNNTNWGYRPTKIDNIIDSIHFVRSKNNWIIQLADVAAYIIYRSYPIRINLQAQFEKLPNFPGWHAPPPSFHNSMYDYFVSWAENNSNISPAQKIDFSLGIKIQKITYTEKIYP